MKKKISYLKIAMLPVLAGLVYTSCDTENALEVTNPFQREYNKKFSEKFGAIDQNQNFCMADTAKAVISVYGLRGEEDYTLQLYTDNPIASDGAKVIASKNVHTNEAGNAEAKFVVDVTKGVTMYYACYVDKDNRRNVKPVTLVDGVIAAQFGQPKEVSGKKRASANSNGYVVPGESYPAEVNDKYGEAKELSYSNSSQNWSGSPDYATVLKISKGAKWTGNIDVLPSESQYGSSARTLYVDGTWELNGSSKLGAEGLIVVRDGGTIIIPANSHLNTANGGRIVVLPGGSITGEGMLTFCNGSGASYDYNGGVIKVGTMNNNGGRVFNYGLMEVGELQGGAGLSEYYNHGKMILDHTGSSSNNRIYTACCLEVKHNLSCRNLKMGNPSYVHVGGNLLMSVSYDGTPEPAEIMLAQNAHLAVDGGVALNRVSIVGPTDGWAICEFGQIGDPDNQFATNYGTSNDSGIDQVSEGCVINNLYISIDKTEVIDNYYSPSPYAKFTLNMMNGRLYDVVGHSGDASNNWAWIVEPVYRPGVQAGNGAAVIIEKGQANLYLPETQCGQLEEFALPEYVGAAGRPSNASPVPNSFILASEDLGTTADVDYNDVVFSISHVAGSNKMVITPLAAGGTFETHIRYDGSDLGEIHYLLGEPDIKKMVNTLNGITNVASGIELTVPEDWNFTSNYEKFSICVYVNENSNESQIITAPKKGNAPFMIIVPDGWEWPKEKINIEEAYPGFTNWTKDATISDWASKRVEGKTIKR